MEVVKNRVERMEWNTWQGGKWGRQAGGEYGTYLPIPSPLVTLW
jgi:hypothetical protein